MSIVMNCTRNSRRPISAATPANSKQPSIDFSSITSFLYLNFAWALLPLVSKLYVTRATFQDVFDPSSQY